MKEENFVTGLINDIRSHSFDTIVDDLPDLLRVVTSGFSDEVEKEVFLIGSLGVVSGMLPNVVGHYAGKWIAPNLYVYILAGYGGGKGGLVYAKELGSQIHKEKREAFKQSMKTYLREMEEYKKDMKFYYKNNDTSVKQPKRPVKPPMSMLYIPGNISKSGIYQLLEENTGRGVLFETEGDTLATAIKQDFGNFSDTLRKAFHHESLELFRRLNDEMIEIIRPELSVVISSTFDQLKYLIPTVENGLFSRFLFYELKQDDRFIDVFDDSKKEYRQIFYDAGNAFKALYQYLIKRTEPIYFWLSEKQQEAFLKTFSEKKATMIRTIDPSMAGTANRLGIIAFRLIMLFTVLRRYTEGKLDPAIVCSDTDFDNALRIVDRFERHANTVYTYLNKETDMKDIAFQLHDKCTPIREIEKVTGIGRGTLSKWFNKNK